MSRTNVFPTYIPELDYKILQDTDDANLLRSCNTNTYLVNLCDDEIFWRDRSRSKYAMLIKFREPTMTWKAFYIRLVNDAMYIVSNPQGPFIYSNIKQAYDRYLADVLDQDVYFSIRLIYKGAVKRLPDEPLLFNGTSTNLKDVLQYPNLPGLKIRDIELFYYSGFVIKPRVDLEEDFEGIFDYNYANLVTFMNYTPYEMDDDDIHSRAYHLLTLNSNQKGMVFVNNKYGYKFMEPILIDGRIFRQVLVDGSLFNKTKNFELLNIDLNSITTSDTDTVDELIERGIEHIMRGIN